MTLPLKVCILGGCGHIGSALLTHLLAKGVSAESVDLGLRSVPPALAKHNQLRDYRSLGRAYLQSFTHVVLLAGHSSVLACSSAPTNAADSLVVGLRRLWTSMGSTQRLIFASSASVLCPPEQARLYDRLMAAREGLLLALMGERAMGLRFGTVCGPSPNARDEMMLNSMVRSALVDGVVKLSNAGSWRPVLGIDDLCAAVDRILHGVVPYGAAYNLCSFNETIGIMAGRVGALLKVPVVGVPGVPTYDFTMVRSPEFVCTETLDLLVEKLVKHYRTVGHVAA